MSFKDQQLSVLPGAVRSSVNTVSPDPPPSANLNPDEQALWDYICSHLQQAGIEHITSGITILMVVRTFFSYEEAERLCKEKGRVQFSKKNNYATPYPWADDEKRLKMELGQWLPKLCLTIPSLQRVRKDMGNQGGVQDDLFASLVSHALDSPSASSKH